jgi:hypothetical protein
MGILAKGYFTLAGALGPFGILGLVVRGINGGWGLRFGLCGVAGECRMPGNREQVILKNFQKNGWKGVIRLLPALLGDFLQILLF